MSRPITAHCSTRFIRIHLYKILFSCLNFASFNIRCFSIVWKNHWVNHELVKFIFLFAYATKMGWPNIVFFHQHLFTSHFILLHISIFCFRVSTTLLILFSPNGLTLGGAITKKFTRYVPWLRDPDTNMVNVWRELRNISKEAAWHGAITAPFSEPTVN